MNTKISTIIILVLCIGCTRDYEDIFSPPNSEHIQSMKDIDTVLKDDNLNVTPALGELSVTDYYTDNLNDYSKLPNVDQKAYIWAKDLYGTETPIGDWSNNFYQIYVANQILRNGLYFIDKNEKNKAEWNHNLGYALFIRGYAHYNLVQLFAKPYDTSTLNELGIPITTYTEIFDFHRNTIKESYDRIITDLLEASIFLPDTIVHSKPNRACKQAAFALLARVYLSMRKYDKAAQFADSCLNRYNQLMDYNTVQPDYVPFRADNREVLYMSDYTAIPLYKSRIKNGFYVDTNLYKMYSNNDLRRTLYYKNDNNKIYLNTDYTGDFIRCFSGLAVDEVYLIRAECAVRTGQINKALADLNTLLTNRIETGTFQPITTTNPQQILQLILDERRKELAFRGLRWSDIRRLNMEGAGIVQKRIFNNQTYSIEPNSPLYVLPIPATTGLVPNPR